MVFSCIVNLGCDVILGGKIVFFCGVRDYDTWNKPLLLIILNAGIVLYCTHLTSPARDHL